ncbi:G-protein coupled receptor GRL101-like [Babylonia areolata]|uniref:G-protein coupled receptor GRL101-like n=1 Tax=Babylonia areolata TaxID=304850 RepID=UPI003FD49527
MLNLRTLNLNGNELRRVNVTHFVGLENLQVLSLSNNPITSLYLYHDDTWKSSVSCKVAGFLSLLSSEVSALFIWLITLDRFIVIHFPFSTLRFQRMSATMACLLTWFGCWFLALLPLLPMTSHWEFYSQTGTCIPLSVTGKEFKGKVFSFSVLIVLNFVLFLSISVGQALIYWSIKSTSLKTNTTKVSRDMTIAGRLITVAVTDFLCWFPIGICGMLALAGTPIPGEVSVALSIFVLPLNSAVNPFMYTFNTLAEKRRKTNEDNFVKWLESNADLIMT